MILANLQRRRATMCVRSVVAITYALGILLFACGIAAGQVTCSSSILVTVLNRETNQPVDGLRAGDFHATLGDQEISVRSLSPAPQHRRIVFVIDRSGSIISDPDGPHSGRDDPNSLEEQTLEDAVSAVPSGDLIAFLAFTGKNSVQTEFVSPSTARQKIPQVFGWKPKGAGNHARTALWDNLHSAFLMLTPHEPGDVIIVLTDGGDNRSAMTEGKLRKEFQSSGVSVLAMGIENRYAETPSDMDGLNRLLDLAKQTGGAARESGPIEFGDQTDYLLPVFPHQLIEQLSHQYALELDYLCVERPEKLRIDVRPLAPHARVRIFYSHVLFPRP